VISKTKARGSTPFVRQIRATSAGSDGSRSSRGDVDRRGDREPVAGPCGGSARRLGKNQRVSGWMTALLGEGMNSSGPTAPNRACRQRRRAFDARDRAAARGALDHVVQDERAVVDRPPEVPLSTRFRRLRSSSAAA